ncbi:hypothetical protein BGZ91_004971, partial [Linnemannia elongata]
GSTSCTVWALFPKARASRRRQNTGPVRRQVSISPVPPLPQPQLPEVAHGQIEGYQATPTRTTSGNWTFRATRDPTSLRWLAIGSS